MASSKRRPNLRITRYVDEAELFRNLWTEYSQFQMSRALTHLERWERDQADLPESVKAWAGRVNFQSKPGEAAMELRDVVPDGAATDDDERLNKSRRVVALYFRKVLILIEQGYFSAPLAAELKALSGRHILLGIVRQLDLAHAEAQHRTRGSEEANNVYERMEKVFGDP
jgi:hypothetical protein